MKPNVGAQSRARPSNPPNREVVWRRYSPQAVDVWALVRNAGAPRVQLGSPTHRGARAIHPGAVLSAPRRYAATLDRRTRTRVRKSSRHHRHSSWVVPESWTSAGTTNERSPVARQQSHATFNAGSPILPKCRLIMSQHSVPDATLVLGEEIDRGRTVMNPIGESLHVEILCISSGHPVSTELVIKNPAVDRLARRARKDSWRDGAPSWRRVCDRCPTPDVAGVLRDRGLAALDEVPSRHRLRARVRSP